jgi:hypothetical protein
MAARCIDPLRMTVFGREQMTSNRCHFPGCDKRPTRNNPSYKYIGGFGSDQSFQCSLKTCTEHSPARPGSLFGTACEACGDSLFEADRGPVVRVRHIEDYVTVVGYAFFHAWCVDPCSICCYVYPIVAGKTPLQPYSVHCVDRVCYHCADRQPDFESGRRLAVEFRLAKPKSIGLRWWKTERTNYTLHHTADALAADQAEVKE